MRARRTGAAVVTAAIVLTLGVFAGTGCGISVHASRGDIGGGPEQATAQALARVHATAVAEATAHPVYAGNGCDCEASLK